MPLPRAAPWARPRVTLFLAAVLLPSVTSIAPSIGSSPPRYSKKEAMDVVQKHLREDGRSDLALLLSSVQATNVQNQRQQVQATNVQNQRQQQEPVPGLVDEEVQAVWDAMVQINDTKVGINLSQQSSNDYSSSCKALAKCNTDFTEVLKSLADKTVETDRLRGDHRDCRSQQSLVIDEVGAKSAAASDFLKNGIGVTCTLPSPLAPTPDGISDGVLDYLSSVQDWAKKFKEAYGPLADAIKDAEGDIEPQKAKCDSDQHEFECAYDDLRKARASSADGYKACREHPDAAGACGANLKTLSKIQGNLEKAERGTQIAMCFLEALHDNDSETLPGKVEYCKGLINATSKEETGSMPGLPPEIKDAIENPKPKVDDPEFCSSEYAGMPSNVGSICRTAPDAAPDSGWQPEACPAGASLVERSDSVKNSEHTSQIPASKADVPKMVKVNSTHAAAAWSPFSHIHHPPADAANI